MDLLPLHPRIRALAKPSHHHRPIFLLPVFSHYRNHTHHTSHSLLCHDSSLQPTNLNRTQPISHSLSSPSSPAIPQPTLTTFLSPPSLPSPPIHQPTSHHHRELQHPHFNTITTPNHPPAASLAMTSSSFTNQTAIPPTPTSMITTPPASPPPSQQHSNKPSTTFTLSLSLYRPPPSRLLPCHDNRACTDPSTLQLPTSHNLHSSLSFLDSSFSLTHILSLTLPSQPHQHHHSPPA